jgi:hypothetical protein
MSTLNVSLTAPEELIEELLKQITALPDLKSSKPILVESAPSSFRSPFGASPDEIAAILKVVSLIFTTGTSVLGFVDKLLELVKKYQQPVVLANPRDHADQLTVDRDATPNAVKGWLEQRR